MSGIPSIAFRVETVARRGNLIFRENRNAVNLAEAMAIMERELRKPNTRDVSVLMVLHRAERRGGIDMERRANDPQNNHRMVDH